MAQKIQGAKDAIVVSGNAKLSVAQGWTPAVVNQIKGAADWEAIKTILVANLDRLVMIDLCDGANAQLSPAQKRRASMNTMLETLNEKRFGF